MSRNEIVLGRPFWERHRVQADHKHGGIVAHKDDRTFRSLARSADQLLEGSGLRIRLARLGTGAQDCHGWVVEIGSEVSLAKIE
jgi:hypothetical protein